MGKGKYFEFHGAFGSKAAAVRKERAVGGFIKPRRIRGRMRYIVMKQRAGRARAYRSFRRRYGSRPR